MNQPTAVDLAISQPQIAICEKEEMILAGDIGGTKTHLALYEWTTERVEPMRLETFQSTDYASLEEMLAEFLVPPKPSAPLDELGEAKVEIEEHSPAPKPEERVTIKAACFGVAGPVIENKSHTTNLPWFVDSTSLATRFDIPHVRLLNDLEAMAHGILLLHPDDLFTLNPGVPTTQKQAIALIAAGTGLGECILYWDGTKYRPMPSEGGHADFAPNSDIEIELLRHVRTQYLHVSYERVVSGSGLHAIYEFLRDTKKNEPTWLAEKIKAGDPAAQIAEAGLKGQAEIAKQTLDLFASIYGAEAGNLALKAMAINGIYLGGGIAPKLLSKLKDGTFMKAFINKGRYKRQMSYIPVHIVMNQRAALIGAASIAAQLAQA